MNGKSTGPERQLDDDQLGRQLAALDANSAAPADDTVRDLHAALETIAEDLRRPVPPDPHAEESALRRAVRLARDIGRDPSPETLVSAANKKDFDRSPLGEIGPYKLLAQLGQGGMGTVYKALHTRLEKVVALKVLPTERIDSPESVARFQREMRAVGKLDHPHIVRAMDAGETDGTHYLVMEHVDGIDLSRLVEQTGPLPISAACELVRQAALGLQAAHSRGMVHRDIKPANVMLARQDFGPPLVKVLDLGLALLSETHASEMTGLTGDGHIMGTIDFMAPEQAGNSHAVDIRADIYSLGATLYALLTGGTIFQGREFTSLLHRLSALANESIPPLGGRRPDVPAELANVVHCMLARDPAERYATPAEAAAALEPFTAEANLAALFDALSAATGTDNDTLVVDTRKLDQTVVQAPSRDVTQNLNFDLGDGTPAESAPATSRRSSRRGNRPVFIACAAAFAGLAVLGGIVLSMRTPHGEVVVELGDDVPAAMAQQLEIKVLGNGDVKVADASQGWAIDVKEGKYAVELAGGNDRFQLDKSKVTVTRGERTFVTVSLKPLSVPPQMRAPKPVAGTPLPATSEPADLAELPDSWQPTPEQQAFFDAIAARDAKAQVEAVRKKLMEVNPGFDGELKHDASTGNVTWLGFDSDHVSKIWPLRGLRHLETLVCEGTAVGKGKLSDLSPLQGMPLKALVCSSTRVSDLGPLVGMPLTGINCMHTLVSDLSPLEKMPLETLNCSDSTLLKNLSVLHRMKSLRTINYDRAEAYIESLWQPTPEQQAFVDAVPFLDAQQQIATVAARLLAVNPEFDGKLKHTIKEGRVVRVDLAGAPLRELWPLAGLTSLQSLDVSRIPAKDLAPLQRLSALRALNLAGVNVDRIPFVTRLRNLESLDCRETRIRNLAPLAGLPLTSLQTFAVSPLNESAVAVLRELPNLESFNGQPLETFFARRDQLERLRKALPALSAEQQLASVLEMLKTFNPGFEGELTSHTMEEGRVTSVSVRDIKQIADLSPLSVLPLTALDCWGTSVDDLSALQGMHLTSLNLGHTRVSDLAPLADLPLTYLDCTNTRVADLSPLREMKLTVLFASRTEIADLSPLAGMQLTNLDLTDTRISDLSLLTGMPLVSLAFEDTRVSDLSPLEGMQLRSLKCSETRVTDLSPLKGMPLSHLYFSSTRISDLSPLKGMPLHTIGCWNSHVADLSPLAGMPLEHLFCHQTQISDLAPLKGLPLTWLVAAGTEVADLSPLKGMPLDYLELDDTRISDLSPLEGMKLQTLNCAQTRVTDLAPLEGMPLSSLSCGHTGVTDLSPLAGMPLTGLDICRTPAGDLSPLKGLPLERLQCQIGPFDAARQELLRSLPLQKIRDEHGTEHTPAEYFQSLATRRKAVEEFAAEIATLPADEQPTAIATKLKELNPHWNVQLLHKTDSNAETSVTLALTDNTHDLSPLHALSQLNFSDVTRLTLTGGPDWLDLSAIAALPLKELNCTQGIAAKNAALLRGIETLRTINNQPAHEYLDTLTTPPLTASNANQ